MGLQLGAEYALSTQSTSTNGTDYDVNQCGLGAFVGYGFPLPLRVFGTYFFNQAMEFDPVLGDPSLVSIDELKGSGYKVGLGFSALNSFFKC